MCRLLLTGEITCSYCHAILLKPYHEHPNAPAGCAVNTVALRDHVLSPASPLAPSVAAQEQDEIRAPDDRVLRVRLNNLEILNQLPKLLQHLSGDKHAELMSLIQEFPMFVFRYFRYMQHDIDVGDGLPIRLHFNRFSLSLSCFSGEKETCRHVGGLSP